MSFRALACWAGPEAPAISCSSSTPSAWPLGASRNQIGTDISQTANRRSFNIWTTASFHRVPQVPTNWLILCKNFCDSRGRGCEIGYARVSTLDQNLRPTMQALKKAGWKKIFREKVSGVSRQPPEFQRMLEQRRDGDTVIVWKVDRLARSTRTSWKQWKLYAKLPPRFPSLSEPWADPTTHVVKLIM